MEEVPQARRLSHNNTTLDEMRLGDGMEHAEENASPKAAPEEGADATGGNRTERTAPLRLLPVHMATLLRQLQAGNLGDLNEPSAHPDTSRWFAPAAIAAAMATFTIVWMLG